MRWFVFFKGSYTLEPSKGRKAHKVLRQHPYSTFVKGKGLLDLEKYARLKTLAKAQ
jgi:hypothetical protein